jgi:hypothetical protein
MGEIKKAPALNEQGLYDFKNQGNLKAITDAECDIKIEII